MSTSSTMANPSRVHDPGARVGFAAKFGREFRRPLPLALLVLAVLGWMAAALVLWREPPGQERQQTRPAEHSENQEKVLAELKSAQQKLATAQSALSTTLRLRDQSAQALQEVKERSAAARKDLAAARDRLEETEQSITTRTAELTTISTRLETARLRESQENSREKEKPDPSTRPAATETEATATTVATTPEERPAQAPPAKAKADPPTSTSTPPTSPGDGSTAAIAPAGYAPSAAPSQSVERHSSPIAQAAPTDTASPATPTPTSPAAPSPEATPDHTLLNPVHDDRSTAVIGPGDFSFPSDFERHSGRISRRP